MQEAQASCDGGGSGLPDSRPISPSVVLPRRPSFSLHLYDRFVKDNNAMTAGHQDLMDIDNDISDAISGVPPSADDAILSSNPLSPRSHTTTPRVLTAAPKIKSHGKRESADDPRLVISAKKPASSDPINPNNMSGSNQGGTSPSSLPSVVSSAITHRYSNKDQPPFIVQVQAVQTQDSGSLHPLHISRIISQTFPRDILEIRKAGRSKVLVQTSTYEAANRLVSNNSLSSHNLQAFIPSYKVLRAGIIRDVPQDVSVELIRESISSPIKILEIHRLNRRIKVDNEIRYVPSRTLCLKFAGQSLPRFVYLSNCRYAVFPFVPKTRICFSCFRVGHLSKSCKSRPRCLHCGDAPHGSSEVCDNKQSSPKCINCDGDHLATSHDCPKVMTHRMALSLAATENIPFADALRSVCSSLPSSSTSITDPRMDFHNFPPLPRRRTSQSPPHFFSPNSFSPLSSLSTAGVAFSPAAKSFSSALKYPSFTASRPIRGPRPKQSPPPSPALLLL